VLPDQAARDTIHGDLDRNVVVQAGAGAGKTEALVGRMVACVSRGVRVDQLVAITFTRKAAGELKQRFTERLVESAAAARGDEAARLRDALRHVDDCFVGTIHAFCGRLLRERPVEAGLQPDFVELDEREDVAVWNVVREQFIEDLYASEDPLLAGLTEVGCRPSDLGPFFRIRYECADVALKRTSVPEPSLVEAVTESARLIDQALPYLPTAWSNEDDFTRMARRAVLEIANDRMDTSVRQAEFLNGVLTGTRKGCVKNTKWRDRAVGGRFRDELIPKLRADHVEPAMTAWRQFVYMRVASVADAAIAYYEAYRRRNGLVTFFDLLERTVALLRDHPDVRAYFQQRYSRLFVDEFQDTDPLQAQMLLLLSSEDVNETDWTRAQPRPGSLFIVGDEKQSIYRFRRADIEIFRAVSDQIEQAGGRVVLLTTSFRTLGALCATLNNAFRGIFSLEPPEYQAPFAPLEPHRPGGEDAIGARRLIYSGGADVEAGRVADFIAAAMTGSTMFNVSDDRTEEESVFGRIARPSDFLVVARERRNLGAYARALEERGIPFDISGGDPLGKSDELGLLVDILAAIERPEDPLAYLKYLRGELNGVSDAALYDYRQSGGSFNYTRTSNPAANPQILEARERIVRAERFLKDLPPYAAMTRIVEDYGLLAYSAGLPEGTLRAGSMTRVLSYVRQWAGEGKGWVEILRELRGLIRDNITTIETMTLEVGRHDVVRIMTIHQAKGLQAPVVVLADDQKLRSKGGPRLHVTRVHGADVLSAAAVTESRQVIAEPVGWAQDVATEEQFAAAEDTRIRYVAATRARNLLVVCEGEGGFWTPLLGAFSQVPELEVYPEAVRARTSTPIADLSSLREKRNRTLREAAIASRSSARVTGTEDDDYLPATRGGRGKEFGSAVHAVLEHALARPGDPVADTYVESMLRRTGAREQGPATVQAVIEGVERLKASALWHRASVARRRYAEVNIVLREGDEIVRGTIDLVFLGENGWEVVDFKTDHAETEVEVQTMIHVYSGQVQTYARYWSQITGEPVANASLWLFGSGQELVCQSSRRETATAASLRSSE
jgi:ATP-dependent helicase/nuclease subunit A